MKSGYQIVDLKNTDFTLGTGANVAGVYAFLEGNYRRATLLTNVVIGGSEYNDVFVNFVKDSNSAYVGTINVAYVSETSATATVITIADDDTVTVTEVVINGTV